MSDAWTAPDLAGQVAVVTGASRGVGRGIAEVLGECGATVYLVTRSDTAAVAAAVEHTGKLLTSYEAAVQYEFTDTNGRRPDPT